MKTTWKSPCLTLANLAKKNDFTKIMRDVTKILQKNNYICRELVSNPNIKPFSK